MHSHSHFGIIVIFDVPVNMRMIMGTYIEIWICCTANRDPDGCKGTYDANPER